MKALLLGLILATGAAGGCDVPHQDKRFHEDHYYTENLAFYEVTDTKTGVTQTFLEHRFHTDSLVPFGQKCNCSCKKEHCEAPSNTPESGSQP